MVFGDSLTKATRLIELQLAFLHQPNRALSTRELARRLGCAQRTVRKYLNELSGIGRLPVYRDSDGWRLVRDARLEVPPVALALEEAAVLYLAARLLSVHAPEPRNAVNSALQRLAAVVPPELKTAFTHLSERTPAARDPGYAGVFRNLAYGWALRRVVNIEYHSRSSDRRSSCDLRPYLIEPAAWGSSLYVIGRADPPGEMRVFKVGRIKSARLTQAEFHPPPIEEVLNRLDAAWGVWISDASPVDVRLRFSPEVAARVLETHWHPSQKTEKAADGGLVMTVAISSATDILPWILGWGRQCEVLAPNDLRRQVAAEHRQALQQYDR